MSAARPTPPGPGAARRALWIFAAALVLYYANWRPITQADCVPAPYAAWSLVQRGDLELQVYPDLLDAVPAALVATR